MYFSDCTLFMVCDVISSREPRLYTWLGHYHGDVISLVSNPVTSQGEHLTFPHKLNSLCINFIPKFKISLDYYYSEKINKMISSLRCNSSSQLLITGRRKCMKTTVMVFEVNLTGDWTLTQTLVTMLHLLHGVVSIN